MCSSVQTRQDNALWHLQHNYLNRTGAYMKTQIILTFIVLNFKQKLSVSNSIDEHSSQQDQLSVKSVRTLNIPSK